MIPFHQYQRYKMVELVINCIRKENEKFNILEVGANAHKNLEKFLPNDNIIYLDVTLPEELLQDEKYILGDATKLAFTDKHFDIIIALDVLEHVDPERRFDFFSEINRVSKWGFVISAPFKAYEVESAEERVCDYFTAIYKMDITWHKEHLESGLPDLNTFTTYLEKDMKIDYKLIKHGSIDIWERFMKMEFSAGSNNNTEQYWQSLNRYYNNVLFQKDFCEQCLRTFIVSFKENETMEKLQEKLDEYIGEITPLENSKINELEASLYRLLSIAPQSNKEESDLFMQVFIDRGNGFNEVDSIVFKINDNASNINIRKRVELSNVNNIIALRIDPLNKPCYISIRSISLIDYKDEIRKIDEFETNAYDNLEDKFLFLSNDPQIIIKADGCAVDYNFKELKALEFEIEIIENEFKIDSKFIQHLSSKSKQENKFYNRFKGKK